MFIAPTVPGQSDPHHTRHHFKFAPVRGRWIYGSIKFCVHQVYDMHCANFPRHLGRQITRCLIAHPDGADTRRYTAAPVLWDLCDTATFSVFAS
jgi:hypothetical protein